MILFTLIVYCKSDIIDIKFIFYYFFSFLANKSLKIFHSCSEREIFGLLPKATFLKSAFNNITILIFLFN